MAETPVHHMASSTQIDTLIHTLCIHNLFYPVLHLAFLGGEGNQGTQRKPMQTWEEHTEINPSS